MLVFAVLFVGCINEIDEWSGLEKQQTDMQTRGTLAPISFASELDTFTFGSSNGIPTTGGIYWDQTYTNTQFQTTNFTFSHTGGTASGYSYWDGFTVSNVADTTNYGAPGSSDGWIDHQWGSMAIPTGATTKPKFLVGFWGYYMLDGLVPIQASDTFDEADYSNWVRLGTGTQTYTVSTITVAIHPWTYYGILYGDGFARPFVPNEHFDLIVYGVKADDTFVTTSGGAVKSVTYKMADYTSSGLIMPTGWTNVTINFGEPVKYLVFQMFSSDSDPTYGPNTAVYFCLRDIVMQ